MLQEPFILFHIYFMYSTSQKNLPPRFYGSISPPTENCKIKIVRACCMFISMQNYKILFTYL